METTEAGCIAVGNNRLEIGRVDEAGYIWRDGVIVLRVEDDCVYCMHDLYLGRLRHGIASTDRGELIFTLSRT